MTYYAVKYWNRNMDCTTGNNGRLARTAVAFNSVADRDAWLKEGNYDKPRVAVYRKELRKDEVEHAQLELELAQI